MTGYLDRFNLRPQEKRLVVVIGFVFFLVFNIWFIWPHFHDWANLEDELAKTRHKVGVAREEIGRVGGTNGYEARLKRLESAGDAVQPEEQAIKFAMSVEQIARQSGLPLSSVAQVQDSTDIASSKFFVEKSLNISFENVEERVLVGFLYNLGAKSSMFRVKDLDVKPYIGQYRLSGRVTLIASYLKDPGKAPPAPAKLAGGKLSQPLSLAPADKKPPETRAVKTPASVPGKGPMTVNKPGPLGNRPGLPGNRPAISGARPMNVPTNGRPFRVPAPASKQ